MVEVKLSDYIYYEEPAGVIYCGDALDVLKSMQSESVQCCVTSPAYWGLRDYGTASWEGGDTECDHRPPDEAGQTTKPTSGQRQHAGRFTGPTCYKCGATRIDQQLGLEKTPEAYVEKMVEIFREVRRVLRKDGTLWLNLGDSYNAARDGGWAGGKHGVSKPENAPQRSGVNAPNLKPKDLVGIPWRVAFALQADGWYLRSDIIWSKPNPMPESVTDRPTKAHEYIFLMSKSAKYHYDADAIRETATGYDGRRDISYKGGPKDVSIGKHTRWKVPDGWDTGTGSHGTIHREGRTQRKNDGTNHGGDGSGFKDHSGYDNLQNPYVRNKRSVWTVATQPFTGWTQTSRLVRVAQDELSDGNLHIVSPNCQVHGVLFALLATALCGEHEVEMLTRSDNNENHPALRLFDDYGPSDWLRSYCFGQQNLDSLLPDSEWTATLRNSQNHRKAHALLTSFACTPFSEIASRIDDILAKHGLSEHHRGIVSNNTWPDVMGVHLLDQILHRTVGKSSSVSLQPPCCCPIYKIKTDKTSHFAVFPEKLIEPCILAGCPKGGIVLDPFIGSGTVAAVSKKHGRKFIGVDLKAEYIDMAKPRLAQEVLL